MVVKEYQEEPLGFKLLFVNKRIKKLAGMSPVQYRNIPAN